MVGGWSEVLLKNIKHATGMEPPYFMTRWDLSKYETWIKLLSKHCNELLYPAKEPVIDRVESKAYREFVKRVEDVGISGFNRELQLDIWFYCILEETVKVKDIHYFNRVWLELAKEVQGSIEMVGSSHE